MGTLQGLMPSFPIPAPPGTPEWVGVLFLVAAVAGVTVLVWQAVRYFRDSDDDER